MRKRAMITGLEGQDGYFLSKLLLEKGYEVYGIARKHTYQAQQDSNELAQNQVHTLYGDLTDFTSVFDCIKTIHPHEIYNLAGQSHIPTSWKQPVFTAQVNALGAVRLLESIHLLDRNIRFFQASTSEIFGLSGELYLDENSPCIPRNPYGTAKVFAHTASANYRESYRLYACCGILFNHESTRRSPGFVTRKISHSVARIALGMEEVLELGNLDAVRDWGHAEDYVRAMWMMLQEDQPQDYIIATGEGHSVRDFVTAAFAVVGKELDWHGEETHEIAVDRQSGREVVRVNPAFYRYPRKDSIVGNPTKIKKELGFSCQHSFTDIVEEMVKYDYNLLKSGSAL